MKRVLPWFLLCQATVLYFALMPVPPSGRLRELPRPVANWLNAHDDLANFAVFGVLSLLTLALPSAGVGPGRFARMRAALSPVEVRLAGLLALVAGLELAQRGISGRESDWRDVATGATGVLAAWVVWRVWVARIRRKSEALR